MSEIKNQNSPWVLLEVNNIEYAVSCNSVFSLSKLPKITPYPNAPKEVRGVTIFRGKSIQFIDLRLLLGFESIFKEIEDFGAMMDQRYQDHINWVNNLEKSVMEGKEFTLSTDPHKCAFGKWYDTYELQSKNIMFMSTFARFDAPHKEIHSIAQKAQEFLKNGQKEKAVELINNTREVELKQMLQLFSDLKVAYAESKKEIMVVIGNDNNLLAFSVDQVVSIEKLYDFDEYLIEDSVTDTKYLSGLAKRKNGTVVFILNDDYLLSQYK